MKLERILKLLRRLEWPGHNTAYCCPGECPACGGKENLGGDDTRSGHADGCELKTVIDWLAEQTPTHLEAEFDLK